MECETIEKQIERANKTQEIAKKRTEKKAEKLKKKFDSKLQVPAFKLEDIVLTKKPKNQSTKIGKSNSFWNKKADNFFVLYFIKS